MAVMQSYRTSNLTVVVDYFPESAFRYLNHDAIVCIDVMCTTTALVTAAAQGRRAFPAPDLKTARSLARQHGAALVTEVEDQPPEGFEPVSLTDLSSRTEVARPLVMLSDPGTHLIVNSAACRSVYAACFRNMSATAGRLARGHERIAVLAACSRGKLRCEDQMAAAWIAEKLIQRGASIGSRHTADLVSRWSQADVSLARLGKSAEQLRRAGRHADVDFVVNHLDDLDLVFRCQGGELKRVKELPPTPLRPVSLPSSRVSRPLSPSGSGSWRLSR